MQRKVKKLNKMPSEPINQPVIVDRNISIIGLGYVGLMIGLAFAKNNNVVA